MKENQFNVKVGLALKNYKVYSHKVVDRVTAGIPDIILCNKGQFIGIELKVDDRPLSDIQVYWRGRIMDNGGQYYVMRWNNATSTVLVEHPFYGEATFTDIKQALDYIGLERNA